jgi:asparagine synthase (glutamine-hydrolysing)
VAGGNAALGLLSGVHSYTSGTYRAESDGSLVVWCGYFPRFERIFEENGLPANADAGENILALYRREGAGFLSLLPGMFSLVVCDRQAEKLIVAGDRNGFFPVYYSDSPETFLFSSSIKAVRSLLPELRVNRAAVAQHLLFDAQYGSDTYYEDVKSLTYGGYLEVDLMGGVVMRGRYFAYEDLFDPTEYGAHRMIDPPTARGRLLVESVRRIMGESSGDTFGLLCGGGIDCTLVGATLKEAGFNLPIFCGWISDVGVRETEQAREVTDRLGIELVDAHLPREQYYPNLLKNFVDIDQPIVHPNLASSYVTAETVRAHGRPNQVLGVSSDMLFGGTGNVRSLYRYTKLRKVAGILPGRIRTLIDVSTKDAEKLDLELRMRNPLGAVAELGAGNFPRASTQKRIAQALSGIADPHERAVKILMLENLCDYQQHLLNRRYELTAGEGISYYFPFLDLDVVRFAINLPVSHCVGWHESKLVVRKALSAALGERFAKRPKWGGDVPLDKWVAPLKFLLHDGFVVDWLEFDHNALMGVAEKHPKLLWNLIDIELWGRICIRHQPPEEILDLIRARGIDCAAYDR